jgi:LPS-assembly lipoprotein
VRRAAALLVLALPGCGLHPLYSGGTASPVAATLVGIEVAPIEGRAGWLLANALKDRLGAAGRDTPRYRLRITLDDQILGLALRRDNAVTRERRTLRARYQLVDLQGGTNAVLLDATAGSDAGVDVVSSEYATIAAENTALENLSKIVADQIVTRVAIFARTRQPAAPAP